MRCKRASPFPRQKLPTPTNAKHRKGGGVWENKTQEPPLGWGGVGGGGVEGVTHFVFLRKQSFRTLSLFAVGCSQTQPSSFCSGEGSVSAQVGSAELWAETLIPTQTS